jgi:hypothetical protein
MILVAHQTHPFKAVPSDVDNDVTAARLIILCTFIPASQPDGSVLEAVLAALFCTSGSELLAFDREFWQC